MRRGSGADRHEPLTTAYGTKRAFQRNAKLGDDDALGSYN
jgi:hypothetical protein